MADFNKPSHTQSSDEIVSDLNLKIQAIASLSLNDGTWTNVPIGTVAFDPDTNQFKRKTGTDTWSTIEISLGIGSSLTIGTLSANTVTLLGTPSQSITAASYKLLSDDVAFLKASTIDIQAGTAGTDFNIAVGSAGSGVAGEEDELGANTIIKVINLPSASETARGAVTIADQTFGGTKTFAAGRIQLGNSTTINNNWHITTTENNDGSIRLLSGNHGSGTEKLIINQDGQLGLGTSTPTTTLHIRGIDAGITLQDSTGGSTGSVALTASSSALFVNAATSVDLNTSQINTNANLSIGTSTNTYKLNVARGSSDGIVAAFQRTGGAALYVYNTNLRSYLTTDTSGNTALELNESGDYLAGWTNGSERLRITASGTVGIGTTSPEQTLDVSGGIQTRSKLNIKSSPPFVGLIDQNSAAATNSAFLYADSGNFYLLRGSKGSESWSHNSTNIWPLQINLNTNEAQLGGNVLLVNSASKLGIGTSSPTEKLSIQSAANVSAGISLRGNNNTSSGEVVVSQGGDSNAYLWNRAAAGLFLGTSNLTRLCIDAQGRLAINGTPSPWNTSLTNTTIDASGGLGIMVYAGNTYIGQNMYWNSSNQWTRKNSGASSLYVIAGDGSHYWHSAPSGAANSNFSYNQNLALNSSGDLSVTRNISAADANLLSISCRQINTNGYSVYSGGLSSHGGPTISGGQGAYIGWNYQSGDGATYFTNHRGLGAGGWVFSNISSDYQNPKDYTVLSIDGNGNGIDYRSIRAYHNADGVNLGFIWKSAIFYGVINKGTTCVLGSNSDYRMKTNCVPIDNALTLLGKMKPIYFNYINDQTGYIESDVTRPGFVAHELQEVLPAAVVGEKDKVDEEGHPCYQSVDYAILTTILTAGVNEIVKRVHSLEKTDIENKEKIQSLENRLAALERKLLG